MVALPYVHLNLRDNPCGELDSDVRARLAVVEPLAVCAGEGFELREAILTARIEAARRGFGPVPPVGAAPQQQLLDRVGDELRAVGSHLYDVFQ